MSKGTRGNHVDMNVVDLVFRRQGVFTYLDAKDSSRELEIPAFPSGGFWTGGEKT